MGARKRRAADRAGRPAMRSPGRPPVGRREHRQRFWVAIAGGSSSEDAGLAAGVSPAVGSRWFREGGGMPTVSRAPLSGRYLSFAEREEIAILRVQDVGVREIARRLGRSPSTISRELRRNPWRAAGVSGHDRPMARQPASHAPEGRQAGRQPAAPGLCTAAAGGSDHAARRHGSVGPGCRVDRSAARASQGPAVGPLLESRADRRPAVGRLPR